MSTLKSNIIEPATGTTLTLGAAGDTLTLASDSLQTNLYKDSGANTIFQSDGSGTLSNINSGITGGGPTLISTSAEASNSASIEITSGIDSTYDSYMFHWVEMYPVTLGAAFGMQVSTDGGVTYATNVTSTTSYLNIHYTDNSNVGPAQWAMLGNATSIVKITQNCSSTAANASSGFVTLYSPSSTYVKHFLGTFTGYHSNGGCVDFRSGGYFLTGNPINAIKFYFDSGNITSGKIKMYGIV